MRAASLPLDKLATAQAQPETVALFVSDLHLSPDMPKTAQAFLDFLSSHAASAQALYLLGDIFEYWAGDDDLDEPFNQRIVLALHTLTERGVSVYWLAGNRDFLVQKTFAHASGVQLLDEPYLANIAGQRLLLVHGDAQCTDDLAYMAFRAQVRDPEWQQAFLARPLQERKAIIAGLREGSREAQREKPMSIMDVNPTQINKLFSIYAVKTLMHGHTHRPAMHETNAGTRYVLPDWDCDTEQVRGGWFALGVDGQITSVTLT